VTATTIAAVPLVAGVADRGVSGVTAVDVGVSIVAFVLLMLRRRAPVAVFGAALVAGVLSQVPNPDYVVLQVVVCVTLYTVAVTHGRRTTWFAWALAAGSLFVTATTFADGAWRDGEVLKESLQLIAWTGIAAAAGDAVRSQRAYVGAMRERAERAEAALEEEARRQVVEERLRIARELHDVVAHHIAMINVQAGVAAHLLRDDPDAAATALAHVRRGATSVLGELSDILTVMRRPDDPASATDPLPTLDQLDAMIAEFRSIGYDVAWHTSGAPQQLSPAVGLTAYRIVQEALTNAQRHGSSPRARLRVDYTPGEVHLEILNPAVPAAVDTGRGGHGTVGMRERVAAAGGSIDIGPTADHQFRVHAVLPAIGDPT
jgi:signal transduction histidine kinase